MKRYRIVEYPGIDGDLRYMPQEQVRWLWWKVWVGMLKGVTTLTHAELVIGAARHKERIAASVASSGVVVREYPEGDGKA